MWIWKNDSNAFNSYQIKKGSFFVWLLVFENFEIVFRIRIPTFGGGLFYKTFWFEASLYMFLIFWNFRGSLLSLIFGFWKFRNCILNQNYHFWWGLFYKTFWFEASLYMFVIFWNFRGSFLSLIFDFWNFEIVFWIIISTFGGSVL